MFYTFPITTSSAASLPYPHSPLVSLSSLSSGHPVFPCCFWDSPSTPPLQSFALFLSTAWNALLLDICKPGFIFYMASLKYSLAVRSSLTIVFKISSPQLTRLTYLLHSSTLLFSTVLRGSWLSKYFIYLVYWRWSPYLDWKSPAEGTLIDFVHFHIPRT